MPSCQVPEFSAVAAAVQTEEEDTVEDAAIAKSEEKPITVPEPMPPSPRPQTTRASAANNKKTFCKESARCRFCSWRICPGGLGRVRGRSAVRNHCCMRSTCLPTLDLLMPVRAQDPCQPTEAEPGSAFQGQPTGCTANIRTQDHAVQLVLAGLPASVNPEAQASELACHS